MASAVSSGFRPPGPGSGNPSSGINLTGSGAAASNTTVSASSSTLLTSSNVGSGSLNMAGLLSGAGSSSSNFKPVPMKLFATWEVDRTPPNCIPRLCSLTLTRLVLNKPLGADLSSVIIAVKMQSSKRTLRSNEIELPSNGLLDTELELTFSLQYPHFLKREGNLLHIMLQRRKKYKNRTILGFKTLAVGIINMSQVLQKQMDLELELFGDLKDKSGSSSAVGKVYMLSLSSQPVDHEDATTGERQKSVSEEGTDHHRVEIFSDDEDDFSSPEEGSDSEPMLDDQVSHSRRLMSGRKARGLGSGKATGSSASAAARQRNLKQKFVSLLKKFKVTDPEELDQEQATLDEKISAGTVDPADIEDLFDQLEDYSDSGPDADTISIGSTPKPSLKPFFCSSRNLLHEARSVVHAAAVAKAQTSDYVNLGGNPVRHPSSDHGGVGSDRISDDSSKEAVSDSHPDTLTDPEFSDPPLVTSSPPQSGDEIRRDKDKDRERGGTNTNIQGASSQSAGPSSGPERKSRLFSKDKSSAFSLKQQKQGSSNANNTAAASIMASASSSSVLGAGSSGGNRIAVASSLSSAVSNAATSSIGDNQPRKALLEQLSRILPSDSDTLPDQLILANTCDRQGAHLAAKLADYGHRVICTAGQADVRATLTCLVAKLQKFCNTKTQNPHLVKVALVGSDTFVNQVLRPYVELFSSKPPDWQGFIKFFIIPLGVNSVSKHIGNHDPIYASLFLHESWKELLEMAEPGKAEVSEIVSRVTQYLAASSNENLINLPVAEAMVTYKEKSSDEESSQVFIPFVSDVKVGTEAMPGGQGPTSMELEDTIGSPPNAEGMKLTPPSSPHVGSGGAHVFEASSSQQSGAKESRPDLEPIDLQLDYWIADSTGSGANASGSGTGQGSRSVLDSRSDSKREFGLGGSGSNNSGKASIKTSVWFMQVMKLGVPSSSGEQPTFTMHYWLKEKKQKTVMRLGKKKDKDKEAEIRSVDSITRLICLSKGQAPLRVHVDGIEWTGVKFFQLSSQWQTHIKYFPVAGVSMMNFGGTQTAL